MAFCKRPIWRLAYPDFNSKFPHQLRDSSLAHLKLGIRDCSRELEPLQFNPVGANLRDIVMRLLRQPALGAPPKTLESRTAISGEIPRFPFTSSDKVVRVTPSAAAASLMVKPKGSMHWRNTKPPGCGGFFIGILHPPSMVIDTINVQDFAD